MTGRRWWRLTRAEGLVLAAVLLVRFAYTACMQLLPLATRISLTPDARPYWLTARDIAAGYTPNQVDNGFPVILGHLMRWTGLPMLGPFEVLGAAAAASTVVLALWLHDLVRADAADRGAVHRGAAADPSGADPSIGETSTGRFAVGDRRLLILAVGLYPSSLLFSSTGFIRDGWIYVLAMLAVTLFGAAVWSRPSVRPGPLAALVPVVVLLAALRAYAVVALALGACLWFLTERRVPVGRWSLRLRPIGLGALCLGALSWFVLRGRLDPRLRSLRAIADYRATYLDVSSDSNLGIDFRGASPPRFALRYAESLLWNVAGPMPHQVHGAVSAGFFVEVVAMLVAAAVLWRRRRLLGPRGRFLVAQAVAWFGLIAIFNDNLGTAARLRVPAWSWVLVALVSVLPRRLAAAPARERAVLVPLRPRAG